MATLPSVELWKKTEEDVHLRVNRLLISPLLSPSTQPLILTPDIPLSNDYILGLEIG